MFSGAPPAHFSLSLGYTGFLLGLREFRVRSRFPSSTLLPFSFWVPLLKPSSRKKGTLSIKGLRGNLEVSTGAHLSIKGTFGLGSAG